MGDSLHGMAYMYSKMATGFEASLSPWWFVGQPFVRSRMVGSMISSKVSSTRLLTSEIWRFPSNLLEQRAITLVTCRDDLLCRSFRISDRRFRAFNLNTKTKWMVTPHPSEYRYVAIMRRHATKRDSIVSADAPRETPAGSWILAATILVSAWPLSTVLS